MSIRWIVLLAVCVSGTSVVPTAQAAVPKPNGTWKVTSELVTASAQINPDYKPGDERLESWRFTTTGNRSKLKTPAGRIEGRRVGKAWVYEGVYPLDILLVKVSVVLRLSSSKRFRGTGEVGYYDPRYARGGPLYDPQAEAGVESGVWDPKLGAKLGLDAFKYSGKRLR